MNLISSDLIIYMKDLATLNLEVLNSGNISIRLANGLIAIKPSGLAYNNIKKNKVSLINKQGKHISGLKPSSDIAIHLEIYLRKPEINCIIHTHSHYATVMSILGKPLKILSTLHADYFGREIFCMPYVNHRIENIGTRVVKSKENVMLLSHHGTLVIDKDPRRAIKNVVALEEISKINFHASHFK